MDVDGCDGSESLAILAYIESKLGLDPGNLASKLLGLVELLGLALGTSSLKVFDLERLLQRR